MSYDYSIAGVADDSCETDYIYFNVDVNDYQLTISTIVDCNSGGFIQEYLEPQTIPVENRYQEILNIIYHAMDWFGENQVDIVEMEVLELLEKYSTGQEDHEQNMKFFNANINKTIDWF